MEYAFSNRISGTLAVSAKSTDTLLTIKAPNIALPDPKDGRRVAWTILNSASRKYEIVYQTQIRGATITVLRGQEGTQPLNLNAGDLISLNLTTQQYDSFSQYGDVGQFQEDLIAKGAMRGYSNTSLIVSDDGEYFWLNTIPGNQKKPDPKDISFNPKKPREGNYYSNGWLKCDFRQVFDPSSKNPNAIIPDPPKERTLAPAVGGIWFGKRADIPNDVYALEGQQIDPNIDPILYAKFGNFLPDYSNAFIRGATKGADAGIFQAQDLKASLIQTGSANGPYSTFAGSQGCGQNPNWCSGVFVNTGESDRAAHYSSTGSKHSLYQYKVQFDWSQIKFSINISSGGQEVRPDNKGVIFIIGRG